MKRPRTIIGLADVPCSRRGELAIFGPAPNAPAHDDFGAAPGRARALAGTSRAVLRANPTAATREFDVRDPEGCQRRVRALA